MHARMRAQALAAVEAALWRILADLVAGGCGCLPPRKLLGMGPGWGAENRRRAAQMARGVVW